MGLRNNSTFKEFTYYVTCQTTIPFTINFSSSCVPSRHTLQNAHFYYIWRKPIFHLIKKKILMLRFFHTWTYLKFTYSNMTNIYSVQRRQSISILQMCITYVWQVT